MIINTTNNDKDNRELIADLIGKPYSFLKSIRLKGIGSKRMMIEAVSPNLQFCLNHVDDINYANIEMRSGGIIIYINKGLQNFTWVIPFYQLVLYKTDGTSIHAQGRFINFKNNKLFKENKCFFKRLLEMKLVYDERFNFRDI
ncbi:hypothetical protein BZARG_2461 [Bizionia argentinensis JUB59]|uniref:Uncharacterized protein n=1 Tax=Bizionia argentinensis JUB59 TaxID=1046627 RepID=G2ECG5_9FLAO|nr:hypothetical protein [Bizionia argentinensis]EGV43876.1 hypothetical protein BZARG_2461 [Bizionia argentinensis JUB59]